MFARITQFEIDTVRISLEEALARFKEMILPEVRKQPGYLGVYVLQTPEGKGALVSSGPAKRRRREAWRAATTTSRSRSS